MQQRLNRLLDNPTYNLAAAIFTFGSILVLLMPIWLDLSIVAERSVRFAERYIILFFALQMALHFLARGRGHLSRPGFLIDLLLVAPLAIELFVPVAEFPGMAAIRGARFLRLAQHILFFYQQKSFGLATAPLSSPIKGRLFLGVSTYLYITLLILSTVLLSLHLNLVESQKNNRIERIRSYSQSYGLLSAAQVFPDQIIRAERDDVEERFEIINIDPAYVLAHYRYGKDYIELFHVVPGGNVQISFRDLNRRHDYMEWSILLSGALFISALLFSINHYVERLILVPIEHATRVMKLRAMGEEIDRCEVRRDLRTEITDLIDSIDHFYHAMREPADNNLKQRYGYPKQLANLSYTQAEMTSDTTRPPLLSHD